VFQLKINVYFCTKIGIFFELNKLVVISDLGEGSLEVSKLKSEILNSELQVDIIELSHSIPKGDTVQASFFLSHNKDYFPSGTVFYIPVGLSGQDNKLVLIEHDEHIFIGPDNGVLSLIVGNTTSQYFGLRIGVGIISGIKEVLMKGLENDSFIDTNHVIRKMLPQIQKNEKALQAYIHFVDHFGNIYIKISKNELNEWLQGAQFILRLRRDEKLNKINKQISEVGSGDTFAIFSEDEKFIIAGNNMGDGSKLMGLNVLDKVIFEKV
jgi:hypothetical protein